jgi:hypothetical protein
VDGYKGDLVLELRCITEKDPLTPQISWFFDGEKLNNSVHYRLPRNGSLLILDMMSSLAGEYLCKAESVVGIGNATVNLRYAGE